MTGDVIYQLMTDRFYDGDTSNDNPASSPNLYSSDHSNWELCWGGDFAGVTAKMQYLADLAQENPAVTSYVGGAVNTWLSHGVDGIRMDAVKHMPGGWLKSYADDIQSTHSIFLFGEWADPSSASLWPDEVQFANADGQSLENSDVNTAERDVFMSNAPMTEVI